MENFNENIMLKQFDQIFRGKEVILKKEYWKVDRIMRSIITISDGATLKITDLSVGNKYILEGSAKIIFIGESMKDEIVRVDKIKPEDLEDGSKEDAADIFIGDENSDEEDEEKEIDDASQNRVEDANQNEDESENNEELAEEPKDEDKDNVQNATVDINKDDANEVNDVIDNLIRLNKEKEQKEEQKEEVKMERICIERPVKQDNKEIEKASVISEIQNPENPEKPVNSVKSEKLEKLEKPVPDFIHEAKTEKEKEIEEIRKRLEELEREKNQLASESKVEPKIQEEEIENAKEPEVIKVKQAEPIKNREPEPVKSKESEEVKRDSMREIFDSFQYLSIMPIEGVEFVSSEIEKRPELNEIFTTTKDKIINESQNKSVNKKDIILEMFKSLNILQDRNKSLELKKTLVSIIKSATEIS